MALNSKKMGVAALTLALAVSGSAIGATAATTEAAAPTEYVWSMDLDCSICHQKEWKGIYGEAAAEDAEAPAAAAASYKDGEYVGTGKGIGGKFKVTVTIKDGKIADVVVGDNAETQGIGSKAIEKLPALIVEANGIEGVDGMSGASITSKAIFTAVTAALEEAAGGAAEEAAEEETIVEEYAAMHVSDLALKCISCHSDEATMEKGHAKLNSGTVSKRLKKTSVTGEFCLSCHVQEDLAKATADLKVLEDEKGTVVNPHALPVNDDHSAVSCTDCHKAHVGTTKTVGQNAYATCTGCHHAGVFECGTCH